MPNEEELVVTASADVGSAESGVGDLDSRLAKLEQAFIKVTAATTEASAGTERAGAAAAGSASKHQTLADKIAQAVARQKEHAAIAAGVSRELEAEQGALSRLTAAMESHGRTIAMMDDALGSKLGGSVSRVTAGMGALQNAFGTSLGPIALLTAAVVAAGAAFTFIKDSVDKASEWQANLARLGQTVRDQGANWGALRAEVQQWADLQEATTTFSRDEAVQALTELTAAGMDLADSQKTVRVAEDAAAATGHSLTDVVRGLMEAEHGRTRALAELGIGTRQTMHDGMAYNAVLAAIEKQMGGSAKAATETYAGAQAQLANEWSNLEENVGTKLLPMFTSIVEALESSIFQVEHFGETWHNYMATMSDYFQAFVYNVLHGFVSLGQAADDFVHGHFAAAARDANAAMIDLSSAMKENIFSAMRAANLSSGNQLQYEWNQSRSRLNAADTNTGVIAEVGGKLGGGSSDKAAREAAKALRDEIALTIKTLENERNAHKLTIDSEIADLKKLLENHKLTAKERAEITGKIIELQNKEAAAHAAAAKKIEEAEKKKQEAERQHYEELARHLDAVTKIAEDTYGKDSVQYKKALQDEMKALDAWLAHNKDANQQLVDDAKLKYAETFKAYNDEIDAEEKKAEEHEKKLEEQYTKLLEAQQKWADKAAGFIEGFFAKGKKGTVDFAQSFHDMLKKIEEMLLKSALSKMLLGLFGNAGSFAGLGALFGEPQAQTSAAGTNAAQGGIIGAMLGPSGASSVASSLPTSGGLMSMLFGSAAPAPTGAGMGGQTNVVTTIVAAGAGGVVPGSATSVSSVLSGSAGAPGGLPGLGGIPWGRDVGGASLGSYGLAGAGGALVGSLVFGGRGFSDLGGAVGGIAGLAAGSALGAGFFGLGAAAGPIGAVLGALIGAGIGSMFNHDDPNKMPDKYATGSFGQGMADFSGAGVNGVPQFNANGQGFSENASLYQSLGHMGMGAYIGQYIKSTGGAGLTSQEIDEFRGTHGNLVALHNGYLTIDNGKTIWWETLISDAHDAVSRILGAGGAPVFDVSHSFPDFGGATITSAGNYYPTQSGGSGITPSPTSPTQSGGGGNTPTFGFGGSGAVPFGAPTVQVFVGGSIVAQSDLIQTIVEAVGTAQRSGPQSRMSMYSRSF